MRKGITRIEILIMLSIGISIVVLLSMTAHTNTDPTVIISGDYRTISKFTFEGHEYLSASPTAFTHSATCPAHMKRSEAP